ncbi:hypothetical protein AB0I27_16830 [Streptomyces sp. NPDC050597]|uniref:hypothetical protein n=1 Tax=Streptomyces TaxID=1883 RepID=UPI003447972C
MRKGPALVIAVVIGLFALSEHSKKQTAELPDLRGSTLQNAQNTAREAGFSRLATHDALGKDRKQLLGNTWQVCSQTPGAGTHHITDLIDITVVKTDEHCPASP